MACAILFSDGQRQIVPQQAAANKTWYGRPPWKVGKNEG